MKSIIKTKLNHLRRHFDFKKDELGEIEKMYSGEFFNKDDINYKKLVTISYNLCDEYSKLLGRLEKSCSFFQQIKIFFKKTKIIKLLFPIQKYIPIIGENIKVIIGLVDFMGCGFINRGVIFSPNVLVTCQSNTIFAVNVNIDDENNEKKDNLIKLSKVYINKNCWICAGVKISGALTINEGCVIGAGAIVKESIEENSLAVGRPCRVIAKIDESYKSNKNIPFSISGDDILLIKKHISNLKCKRALKEYSKAIKGEFFNSTNISLGKLFIYTHLLCAQLSNENTSESRKKEIIDILFPIHGENFKIGKNFYMDLIGTITVGNNVTILDNVCIAGVLNFSDDVIIENNVTIFASSHSVFYKDRNVKFSLTKGLYEYTSLGFIKILQGVTIGEGAILVPNMIVDKNIPKNALAVNNKIII